MNPSNHRSRPLARIALAAGGIGALIAVCEAADLAARHRGAIAGAAVITFVFAACWIIRRVRPLLHPVPLARRSGTRETEVAAETVTLAGTAASR